MLRSFQASGFLRVLQQLGNKTTKIFLENDQNPKNK